MSEIARAFMLRRDAPDPRDRRFGASPATAWATQVVLPDEFDLTPQMPPVYDQGDLGSCVFNSTAGLVEYLLKKEGKIATTPSRLFGYWNGRSDEGTVGQDAGSSIRTGMKVWSTLGCPPETLWPYDTARFKDKPPQEVYSAAAPHRISAYQRLNQTLSHMRMCLFSGFPFAFGIDCFPEIKSAAVARTGIVPMPRVGGQPMGGHALLATGYSMKVRLIKFRNSWGSGWGMGGYGFLPFDYILSTHAADFWTAQVAA